MPKGIPYKRYTPEFKVLVMETMRKEGPSRQEAERQFRLPHNRAARRERIYLTEGSEGLAAERRGRSSKGRPAKLPSNAEEDLPAEVQRPRAGNAYLKNLQALGWEDERQARQKRW